MPDPSLANQTIRIAPSLSVLLFSAYEIQACDQTDPYRNVLIQLSEEGLHRNVFGVDDSNRPVWRVADYKTGAPDTFIELRPDISNEKKLIGYTWFGSVYSLNCQDGTLQYLRWEKG